MDKKLVLSQIKEKLEGQVSELSKEVNSVNEEIGKETKSSAGDKFETSREMMNQEWGRLEERISHLNKQLNALVELQGRGNLEKVENGALVQTSSNTFFFGLAFGKLSLQGQSIMVLSLNSPIGKAFLGRKEGDQISFMNQLYHIKSII